MVAVGSYVVIATMHSSPDEASLPMTFLLGVFLVVISQKSASFESGNYRA